MIKITFRSLWETHFLRVIRIKKSAPKMIIFALSLLFSTALFSQDLPPEDRCTSKDLEIATAELTGLQDCFTCTEGEVLVADLTLTLINKTGSERTSFAFWGTLEETDSEGNVITTPINGCAGPVEGKTNPQLVFPDKVTYNCGTTLKIKDLYLAWTDAADNANRQCPLDPSGIAPKCGTLDEITVIPPLFSLVDSFTDVACKGDSTGSIDIFVRGGNAPYTYDWADLSGSSNSEDRTNLPAGTYSVTVTDSDGCQVQITDIVISEPAEVLTADYTTNDLDCFGDSDGSIDITASGGTAPYTYLWSNGETTEDLASLSAGTYSVVITDANGCTTSLDNIEITQPTELTATKDASKNVSCYGGSDGSIDITASGGTAPYTYLWSNGATTEDLASLSADTYSVVITDAKGCTTSLENIEITQPTVLTAKLDDSKNVSCYGGSDGSIDISVSGGTSPYTYLWSSGQTTEDLASLSAGTYSVVITDANGCTTSLENIEITQPTELTAKLDEFKNVSCYVGSDGSIDITVSGGTAPYTYLWSNGETIEDLASLSADTYSVVITDAKGCITNLDNIEITQPTELTAKLDDFKNVSCYGGSDGSIDITASGGTAPYTYLWSNGETTEDLASLSADTYSVVITDANGCTASLDNIEITQPTELTAKLDEFKNVSCYVGSDGSIDITVSGGTAPYTYLWSSGQTTEDLASLSAGTYSVVITDGNGCTTSLDNIEITQPTELTAKLDDSKNVSCYGGSDGSIDITVSGGTSPYTYLWSNGETTEDIASLSAGTYSVVITDAKGCTTSLDNIEITQPTQLDAEVVGVIDAACNGAENGSIDIKVSGGTAPYTYLWSNGETTEDLASLSAGTYSVVITDANGCTTSLDNIEITQPTQLDAEVVEVTDAACNGAENGSIDIKVSGGTAPYTYLWSNGATSEDLNNIASGSYSVEITDKNNCQFSLKDIVVANPASLIVSLEDKSDVNCYGGADGSIAIKVEGGTAPYSYSWNNGETTKDLIDLAAGTYSVTVTDANNCSADLDGIQIVQPSELSAQVSGKMMVSCYGGSDGSIDITVSGGTAPYTYLWSNGETSEDLVGITAGIYSVEITDSHNCKINLSDIQISQPDLVGVETKVNDVSCYGFDDGSIAVTISGGTAPYTVNSDQITGNTYLLDNLSPGLYGVTVIDANGCGLSIDDISIDEPEEVQIPVIQPRQSGCIENAQGGVVLSYDSASGISQFFYSYKEESGSNYSGYQLYEGEIALAPGNYSFKVKYEIDGCESDPFDVIIERTNSVDFILDAEVIQPDCETGLGGIIIRINGNTSIDTEFFNYTVSSGSTVYYDGVKQPLTGFAGLPPGTYTIIGKSDTECETGTTQATLEEPVCETFEGCTLGYWKNHTDRWACYSTCTLYGDVFTEAPSKLANLTLLQALNSKGGGIYNLARQSVAAILNTCHGDVNYEIYTSSELIDYVNANFGNANKAGSYLDMLNNAGCTLGGSSATTQASPGCESTEVSKPGKNGKAQEDLAKASPIEGPQLLEESRKPMFDAYPIPFRENLNIGYKFDYTSDVTIQIYNMNGQLLKTYKEKNVNANSISNLNIDFQRRSSAIYIVRMITDREVFVKKIISDK